MRTYYLFIIREEVVQQLRDKEFELFYLLKRILKDQEEMIPYRIPCYLQICKPWPKGVLMHYFDTKYPSSKRKKGYVVWRQSFVIRSSYLKIETDKTIPGIFRLLNYIDPYIFLCDFENSDYFYLKQFMNHVKIKS